MDNKKLTEQELEQVSGGQAVLPLFSSLDGKEEDFQVLSAGYFHAVCPACGLRFPLPLSQKGKQVTCQECGHVFNA